MACPLLRRATITKRVFGLATKPKQVLTTVCLKGLKADHSF